MYIHIHIRMSLSLYIYIYIYIVLLCLFVTCVFVCLVLVSYTFVVIIISCHIISYHIISYRIISYHIYIYIHISISISLSLSIYIYIYTYIYTHFLSGALTVEIQHNQPHENEIATPPFTPEFRAEASRRPARRCNDISPKCILADAIFSVETGGAGGGRRTAPRFGSPTMVLVWEIGPSF